jgi:hypothetical protein
MSINVDTGASTGGWNAVNGAIYLTLAEHLHGLWPIAKAFEEYFRTIATFTEHSADLHEATMVHYKVIYIYMV